MARLSYLYFFFLLLGWYEVIFVVLVDRNYLIAISVDNTIEANYRIIYTLLQKLFLFAVFNINRKTTNDYLKTKNIIPRVSFMRGKEP